MRLQGKQIMRTSDNLSLLYISPYAYVEQDADGVLITRTDAEKAIWIEGYPPIKIMVIFQRLLNGIEQSEIIDLLNTVMQEDASSGLIELLLQEGVVE